MDCWPRNHGAEHLRFNRWQGFAGKAAHIEFAKFVVLQKSFLERAQSLTSVIVGSLPKSRLRRSYADLTQRFVVVLLINPCTALLIRKLIVGHGHDGQSLSDLVGVYTNQV